MKTVKIALLSLLGTGIHSAAGLFDAHANNMVENSTCYSQINMAATDEGGALALNAANCHQTEQTGASSQGNIVQISDLPSAITLGQIPPNAIRTKEKIITPGKGQALLFQFNTSAGELRGSLIQFLIERADRDQLNKNIKNRGLESASQRLKTNNPGQQLELFIYYRRLFGSTAGWLELGQTLTTSNNIAPSFTIAVNDSGKVMIYSDRSNGLQFFDLGQLELKQTDPTSVTPQEVSEHFKDLIEFKQSKGSMSGG